MSAQSRSTNNHLKRWWPAYLVAGAGAAVALAYVLFFTPESTAELSLDNEPAAAPADASNLSGAWVPTDNSIAGYRVREKLAILPAANDAVGRTSSIGGEINIEDDGSTITALAGSVVEVDMTTLQSDESRRDDRIKTTALETDSFPSATFELTENTDLPESLREGQKVTVDATGDLTLHDITKNVEIPLEIQLSGDAVKIVGSPEITMADYGIDVDAFGGFVSIEEKGSLEFELSLQKQK